MAFTVETVNPTPGTALPAPNPRDVNSLVIGRRYGIIRIDWKIILYDTSTAGLDAGE